MLKLIEKLKDNTIVEYPLDQLTSIVAKPGAVYTVKDTETDALPDDMALKRDDATLKIEIDGETIARVEGFFAAESDALFSIDGSLTPSDDMAVPGSQSVAENVGQGELLVWESGESWTTGILVSDETDSGTAATQGGTANAAGSSYIITLGVTAGNFFSTMRVQLYDQDGNLIVETDHDFSTGDFSYTVTNGYSGPVFAKVIDTNSVPDYLDETTGTMVNLGSSLSAMTQTDGENNVSFSVTPLTELACQLAGIDPNNPKLTQDDLVFNKQVGDLFNVPDITGPVTTTVDSGYNSTDGLSDSEQYGNVLAMFSGVDQVSGGVSQTIQMVKDNIAVTGTGQGNQSSGLGLTQDGVELLQQGIDKYVDENPDSDAGLSDMLIQPPVIEAAGGGGVTTQEKDAGVIVAVKDVQAGDAVVINWGGQTYQAVITSADFNSIGLAEILIPPGIIEAAGDAQNLAVSYNVNGGNYSPAVIITVDTKVPVIQSVSIPDTAMAVGDTVTVTITVESDPDTYTNLNGNVGGFSLSNLTKVNDTTYTADFSVTDGGTDVAAGSDIPVNLSLEDGAGQQASFTTAISNPNDPIDANAPKILNVSLPDVPLIEGDTVIITLTVTDDGGESYTNLSGDIAGFALTNLTRVDSTTYTAQFEITGNTTFIPAGDDVPVNITIEESSGSVSPVYTTPVSQANDVIDTIPPEITGVSVPDTAMATGDTVTITITVADDGGDVYTLQSGTVAGFDLSGLTRVDSTTYTAQFTITDDTVIVGAGSDIPVDITLEDFVGHVSNTYTIPISQQNDSINATPGQPVITNVSIPDTAMVTGDTVTVTITVVDDDGDTYTGLSGSVSGFSLSNLAKVNNTTYTAQFTVSDDNTIVPAGGDISVNVTLTDSSGNKSDPYTTDISQANDSINAALDTTAPVITGVSIPDAAMVTGDTVTVTITVEDDGGDTYSKLTGKVADHTLSNLTRVDNTTYTAQFTVKDGAFSAAASDISVTDIKLTDSAGNVSDPFSAAISQANDSINAGLDTTPPVITGVSIPDTAMVTGDTVTVTIKVEDDGGDTYTNLSGTVAGLNLTNLTKVNSTTYTAQFTVDSGTSIAANKNIPVNLTMADSTGNVSDAYSKSISQISDSINDATDTIPPVITGVSIPNTAMKYADVVTVTITVEDDQGDTYTGLSGMVGGFNLGGLTKVNNTTYTATFTVFDNAASVPAGSDIPVNLTLTDSSGNTSTPYTTAISQGSDAIDTTKPVINSGGDTDPPVISDVTIPDTSMIVGDTVTATITVEEDTDTYTAVSGTIGGFSLSNLSKVSDTQYTAQFTITHGGTDVAAGDPIPVSVTITDSSNNTSNAYTTDISSGTSDSIDANGPVIQGVSIPASAMKVGSNVVVTITVADDGGVAHTGISGTVGGFALSGLAKTNNTTYTASFTVANGGTDVATGSDIPVNITMTDNNGSTGNTYTTAISQVGDPIDANKPVISNVSIDNTAMKVGDAVTVTITVADDGGDTYTGLSGTVGGFNLGSLSKTSNTTYTAQFTVTDNGTDVAAGSDIPVSLTLNDSAGNTSDTYNTAISQASDPIDANKPEITGVTIDNTSHGIGTVTVTITVADDGGETYTGLSGTVAGYTLTNLNRTDSTTYTAQFTISQGDLDVATGSNHDVNITLQDAAGNTSDAYTTAISQNADNIDANPPSITNVSVPDSAMNVNDVVTVTITVADDNGDTYTNLSGSVGGFALSNLNKNSNTEYTAQFTVTDGGNDVAAGADIPVSITLDDSAGNTSSAYTTAISAGSSDSIDANRPTLDSVTPADNATGIGANDNLTLTFSENVSKGTGNLTIKLSSNDTNFEQIAITDAKITGWGGTTLTVNPGNTFADNTSYYVVFDDNAILDANGSPAAPITDKTVWNFSTPDNTAPTVSSFTSSTGDGSFKAGETINITATMSEDIQSGNQMTVTLDTGETVTLTAAGNGTTLTGTYTVQAGNNSSDLAVSSFTAGTVQDLAGNALTDTSLPATNIDNGSAIVVDTTAPTVTDGNISISGASGTGGAFKVGDTVTVEWDNTGSGDNNSDIAGVTVNFSAFGGGAAVAASNGSNTWTATFSITSGSVDGTGLNVSVTATDQAGNTTTTADTTGATVDSQPPTVSDGNITITSSGSGTGGAYIIGDTVTVEWDNTGSGDNNSDISGVTVNFSAFGGGAAVAASNSSGTWSASYTLVAGTVDASNLNVSVTATDDAGNTTTTADTSNLTADNIKPTANFSAATDDVGSVTGALSSGDTTDDTALALSGTCESGSTVAVYNSTTKVGDATVTGTNWSYTATVANGTTYQFNVKETDSKGNVSDATSNFTVIGDTAAPTANFTAATDNVGSVTGALSNGDTTDDTSLVLSGTCESGSTVAVYNSTTKVGDATVSGTNWSYTATVANGTTYQFNVKETDAAGNESSATSNFAVTGDTSAPTANFTAATDNVGTVTGALSSGDTTDDTALVLSGTCESGSTVAVYNSTTKIGDATVSGTNWSYTATVANGTTYQFNVKETDAAGNESSATSNFAVTGDTAAPTANFTAATDNVGTVTGALSSGDTTDDTALVLSGTCESGSTVAVYNNTTKVGDATVTGTNWSYTATVADATTYLFNVKETDAAGNESSATSNFTVIGDTTAPTATVSSATWNAAGDTITLTGTNFDTLLESGEDENTEVKTRLDWNDMTWDIDADNATTADVTFSVGDISSVNVTNSTTLTITLTGSKGTALEGTTSYGKDSGGNNADTLDISSGFFGDQAGNTSTYTAANVAIGGQPTAVVNYALVTAGGIFTDTNGTANGGKGNALTGLSTWLGAGAKTITFEAKPGTPINLTGFGTDDFLRIDLSGFEPNATFNSQKSRWIWNSNGSGGTGISINTANGIRGGTKDTTNIWLYRYTSPTASNGKLTIRYETQAGTTAGDPVGVIATKMGVGINPVTGTNRYTYAVTNVIFV